MKFIAHIRACRKFRMIFYNFCYFWGQHCCWTETNIFIKIFLWVSIALNSLTASPGSVLPSMWMSQSHKILQHKGRWQQYCSKKQLAEVPIEKDTSQRLKTSNKKHNKIPMRWIKLSFLEHTKSRLKWISHNTSSKIRTSN